MGLSGRFLALAICPWRASHAGIRGYGSRGHASRGVGDLGAISTSRSGLEIAPRSLTPSEAALGRSHVYQRAEHAKGISLAPGIVPKGQSRRARRPAAHRHQTPPGAPKPTSGGFWRGVTRQYRANRVVPQAVPHPYMMHMLGRGQWVRQGSMRSDARVSGEYATKGLVGERILRSPLVLILARAID